VARANGGLAVQSWHPEAQHLEEVARTAVPSAAAVRWSADGVHLFAIAEDGTRHAFDALTLAEMFLVPACELAIPRDLSPDDHWRAVIHDGKPAVADDTSSPTQRP
jgi:hypothetical protein